MRLKSTLTIVAVAVLAFDMVFATSVTQIDRTFAAPEDGKDNHIDANGGQLSDIFGSSSNPSNSLFSNIFGPNFGSIPDSSSISSIPGSSSSSSSNPGGSVFDN